MGQYSFNDGLPTFNSIPMIGNTSSVRAKNRRRTAGGRKKSSFLSMAVLAVLLLAADMGAASSFYEGKSVRVTVGTSPGGGYDAWGRVVARHLGKHIPGNPSVIVENMPGAGGIIQVNNLFSTTKPDGLTIGYVLGSLLLTQTLGEPGYNFDPQKFIYVGAANKENIVFVLSKKAGVTSMEKWRTAGAPILKVGALARGSSVDNYLRILKDVLGFPLKIVSGYKGTTETRMAMDSGEVAGGAPSLDSAKTSWKSLIDRGDATIFALGAPKSLKEMPNVPPASDFARTSEERRILDIAINSMNNYSRPFVLPPGTPQDRVQILRKAFEETMQDPDFLADVKRMNVTLDTETAEDLTANVATLTKIDPALKAKFRTILFE